MGLFKKKPTSDEAYSEENAYFMKSDITEFYDCRTGEKTSLSYQNAYLIGKEMYEKKYGKLVGTNLASIRSNLVLVYRDNEFKEKADQDLDPSDIGNVITLLGKNAWLTFHCWKHFKNSYRDKFGIPEQMIDNKKLKDFFTEYSAEENPYTRQPSKLILLNSMKKKIHNYLTEFRKEMYDEKSKGWNDFDITKEFLNIRKLMIDTSDPIPAYAWNLIDGNPFYRFFRICKNYMKWKNSLIVYKKVFRNIQNWESGTIFSDDKTLSNYEEELWINWNRIAKDFISAKNKISTMNGGLRWLKEEFGRHILERKSFYDLFTPDNELIISDDIIRSIDKL